MYYNDSKSEKITISVDGDVLEEIKKKANEYGLSVSKFLQIAGQNFELPIKKKSVND